MRLQVLSDLHFEHRSPEPPAGEADVVVLAGDIALGTDGVRWAREWVDGRPALYVAGNHEFYGRRLPDLIAELRGAADGSSVTVLENDAVVLGGVRFLGCTLWSDFEFDGGRELSMAVCRRVVSDYSYIEFTPEDRPLAPADTLALHRESRAWLAGELEREHDGPTVVITHHAPLHPDREIPPPLRPVVGAFASDLSALMGAERVALWIFGHTHRAADREVRGTRVLSNPCGYPEEPVEGYDPLLAVEVR